MNSGCTSAIPIFCYTISSSAMYLLLPDISVAITTKSIVQNFAIELHLIITLKTTNTVNTAKLTSMPSHFRTIFMNGLTYQETQCNVSSYNTTNREFSLIVANVRRTLTSNTLPNVNILQGSVIIGGMPNYYSSL